MKSKTLATLLFGCLVAVSAPAASAGISAAAPDAVPASEQLEKDLQGLSWKQFKAVIMAIPKLKADVDAYGPMGWQYVQANYKTYRWRKNINKLDPEQKVQLAQLIRKSRSTDGALN